MCRDTAVLATKPVPKFSASQLLVRHWRIFVVMLYDVLLVFTARMRLRAHTNAVEGVSATWRRGWWYCVYCRVWADVRPSIGRSSMHLMTRGHQQFPDDSDDDDCGTQGIWSRQSRTYTRQRSGDSQLTLTGGGIKGFIVYTSEIITTLAIKSLPTFKYNVCTQ